MSTPHSNPADLLRLELAATPDCLSADRLGLPLSATEQRHVDECARCRTELTLFREFTDSVPSVDEGAAVQWVAQELRRRTAAARPTPAQAVRGWWTGLWNQRLALASAAVALLAVVIYVSRDPEPLLRQPDVTAGAYRTSVIKVIEPVGDQTTAPSTFVWEAIPGVSRYDVSLLEVDGTPIWRTSVDTTRATVPPPVRARIVPGKTLRWTVVARDATGAELGRTATQEFRVSF